MDRHQTTMQAPSPPPPRRKSADLALAATRLGGVGAGEVLETPQEPGSVDARRDPADGAGGALLSKPTGSILRSERSGTGFDDVGRARRDDRAAA